MPESYPQPAGSVKVGSTIGVRLQADQGDASVTPKDAIDKSITTVPISLGVLAL